MKSVVEYVFSHAESAPDVIAIADKNDNLTYGALIGYIVECGRVFREKAIKRGDCILVECSQDIWFIVAKLACEMYGYVFVPVEASVVKNRLVNIYKSTNAKFFISQTYCSMPEITVYDWMELRDVLVRQPKSNGVREREQIIIEEEELSEILFTTGTTSEPKGIMISHKNNLAIAENIISGTKMKKGSVEIIPLPLSHSHGLRSVYALLVNGCTAVISDGISNVGSFFQLIDRYGVNALDASPSILKILLTIAKKGLLEIESRLDYVQIGTAVLDEDLKEKLNQLFVHARVYNSYGLTEAGRSCVMEIKEKTAKGCVGNATPNASFSVVDCNTYLPITSDEDHPGLVVVSGNIVCLGYWKNEQLTKETIHGNSLFTNDMGYLDNENRLYILGRADDIINYKGIKIMPEEIETVAQRYEGVIDCACVPENDKIAGQIPKLYLQVDRHTNFSVDRFWEWLSHNLEQNRMPKQIELIDCIPKTYNGKKQRQKLQ